MSKVSFRALPKKFANGSYLLLPATKADRNILDQFCVNCEGKYLTVTANYAEAINLTTK